jgi:hypothetical protein
MTFLITAVEDTPKTYGLLHTTCEAGSSSPPLIAPFSGIQSTLTKDHPATPTLFKARPKSLPTRPPRPPNAFMLFRSDFWATEKQKAIPIGRDHRDISRIAGHCWNNLDHAGRARYQKLAEEAKQRHMLQYPEYKYTPTTRREGITKRKSKKDSKEEEERCKKLATLVMKGMSPSGLREAMKDVSKPIPKRLSRSRAATINKPSSTPPELAPVVKPEESQVTRSFSLPSGTPSSAEEMAKTTSLQSPNEKVGLKTAVSASVSNVCSGSGFL